MGFVYNIFVRIVNFIIFFVVVVLIPGLPPKTHFPFEPIEYKVPSDLKGALELNNLLDNGERLLEGRVYGPEAIIARNNEIYTGIHGGEIIKISGDHIRHVAKFGQPCDGFYNEEKCGRPLGLAFDTLGNNLIAADAYFGIWKVDLTNGKKKILISPEQEQDGVGGKSRKPKIFNSVAVAKNGDIFWTDSSSDFVIQDGMFAALSNPSGRVFHYDRLNNVSTLLGDQLHFSNGIALSPKEEFLIVAETMKSRLLKYYLKEPKKGNFEVFLENLPGLPDNLTPDEDGIWVPLVGAVDSLHPQLIQVLGPYSIVRLFIVRVLALLQLPFEIFNNLIPVPLAKKTLHFIGNFETVNFMQPNRATILRVDWNGNIRGSLHGFDKSVGFVSHVSELGDSLLLGSPFNKYIAKVKLPRTQQVKIQNVRYDGNLGMEPIEIENHKNDEHESVIEKMKSLELSTSEVQEKNIKPAVPMSSQVNETSPATIEEFAESKTKESRKAFITTKSSTATKPRTKNPTAKKDSIPINEEIIFDTKPPVNEKIKVIRTGGIHSEL